MKLKYTLSVMSLAIALALPARSQVTITVSNDDDVVGYSGVSPSAKPSKRNLTVVPIGQDALYITSSPASASTNTALNRANIMAGLFGFTVDTDRNVNPAAWYRIPTVQPYGWQWFDVVSTPFHSWKGATAITTPFAQSEWGHRITINVIGTYPASAYTVAISSSLTNIAPVEFGVATNSNGSGEIGFNPQYVGVYFGGDGINQSTYNSSQGRVLPAPGSDDLVFDGGQLPSTNTYSAWARYGSTILLTSSTQAALDAFRTQFVNGNQWLSVVLKKNGTVVASNYISSAAVSAVISQNTAQTVYTIAAVGGQENTPYGFQTRTNLVPGSDVWVPFNPGTTVNSGTAKDFPSNPGETNRFFRLVSQ